MFLPKRGWGSCGIQILIRENSIFCWPMGDSYPIQFFLVRKNLDLLNFLHKTGYLAVHRQLNRTPCPSLGLSVTTNNQTLHGTTRPLRHFIRVMRRQDRTQKDLPTYVPTNLPTYLPTYVPPLENTLKRRAHCCIQL